MGYETVLSLGNKTLFMWRKYANSLPRLLFRYDQIVVDPLSHQGESPGQGPLIRVELRTTALQALETLAGSGLGWSATVAAYSEIMVKRGWAAGMVLAKAYPADQESAPPKEYDDPFEEFDRLGAEVDLLALGTLLVHQLFSASADVDDDDDYSEHETIFEQLTFDGNIDSIFGTVWAARLYAEKWSLELNHFALMRGVESWCALNRDAPLIAWPILLATVLKVVESELPLVYDLTDDAWDTQQVSSIDQGLNYAREYWTSSGEGMASSARVIGKLFGVLSSFDGELSREFWFARAADALDRIKLSKTCTSISTSKIRGDLLEDLVEALVRTEMPDLEVIERNLRTRDEEIDLVVANGLAHPFWISHQSPLIIFECKNTTSKIGVPDLRILESKIHDRSAVCRIGVFVSTSGFTQPFYTRLRATQTSGGIIFAITGDELAAMISRKQRLTEWLRTRGMATALGGRPN